MPGKYYDEWTVGERITHQPSRTVTVGLTQMLGEDDESLMVIECMPAPETRDYVEKVMAAYWSYQRQFGGSTRTLDAVAGGSNFIDARLDH